MAVKEKNVIKKVIPEIAEGEARETKGQIKFQKLTTKSKNQRTKKQKNLLSYYGFTKTDEKKYPVVGGILRQLTPERIEEEIGKVKETELPEEIGKWVREYEEVGGMKMLRLK